MQRDDRSRLILLFALALTPSVHAEQLDNGAWIAAVRVADSSVFSAQVFVRSGSVHDTEPGAGHLLEHLLFANGKADAVAESAGFLLNATTYREFTRLYATGPSGAWRQGVKALATLFEPMSLVDAAKEWRVIAQEAQIAALDQDAVVYEAMWRACAKGTPWANPPVGGGAQPSDESLQNALARFGAANLVVVLAGNMAHEETLPVLRASFSGVQKGSPTPVVPPPTIQTARIPAIGDRVGVCAVVPGYADAKAYVAHEAAFEALTSPSRLLAQGLGVRSFVGPSSSGSLAVAVFQSVDGAPGTEAKVRRLLSEPITEQEFAAAKQRIESRYGSASTESAAIVSGLSLLFVGDEVDFNGHARRLTKVDVDAAAAKFSPDQVAWSAGR